MAESFLGRWSQRKQALRAGRVPPEPPVVQSATVTGLPPATPLVPDAALPPADASNPSTPDTVPPAVPLSMDDVGKLTPESDFKPFAARAIAPEVRNAAMKKLFADPHFNVMDGMDVYIDDYSLADPLPESMLRQMASAQFLKLFEQNEAKAGQAETVPGHEAADPGNRCVTPLAQTPQSVDQHLTENLPAKPGQDHDHTDLRLQPNHAAGAGKSGRGTE